MKTALEETLVTENLEIVLAILATKPAKTPIKDPARQLALVAKDLPDSPIRRALKIHPHYGYSQTFVENSGMLMLGGTIMYGSDNRYRMSEHGHSQALLYKRDMTPQQIEDCDYIGERLQWG